MMYLETRINSKVIIQEIINLDGGNINDNSY
jgi:hypothetical protein